VKTSAIAVVVTVAAAIAVIAVYALTLEGNQEKIIPSDEQQVQTKKIKVIASFFPLYEFSKNVGGDRIEVSSFIPIGVEPHDWEPSPGNIISLKDTSVFVYNGVGLESFVDKLISSGEYKNINFVDASNGITLLKGVESENESVENNLAYDPHIWLDPILAKHQVATIKDALVKTDPINSKYYEENANAYNAKLDELDAKIRNELSDCKKDTFVSFHNAFSYFANRYGIKSMPLTGLTPEAEPIASDLENFVKFVKANDIKIIFAEELVNPKLAQVLAGEAGAQVMILSPLEGLSGEDLKAGKSYIDKMEENLQDLKIALECT
jgi:zinc transport system substrate-binding protein